MISRVIVLLATLAIAAEFYGPDSEKYANVLQQNALLQQKNHDLRNSNELLSEKRRTDQILRENMEIMQTNARLLKNIEETQRKIRERDQSSALAADSGASRGFGSQADSKLPHLLSPQRPNPGKSSARKDRLLAQITSSPETQQPQTDNLHAWQIKLKEKVNEYLSGAPEKAGEDPIQWLFDYFKKQTSTGKLVDLASLEVNIVRVAVKDPAVKKTQNNVNFYEQRYEEGNFEGTGDQYDLIVKFPQLNRRADYISLSQATKSRNVKNKESSLNWSIYPFIHKVFDTQGISKSIACVAFSRQMGDYDGLQNLSSMITGMPAQQQDGIAIGPSGLEVPRGFQPSENVASSTSTFVDSEPVATGTAAAEEAAGPSLEETPSLKQIALGYIMGQPASTKEYKDTEAAIDTLLQYFDKSDLKPVAVKKVAVQNSEVQDFSRNSWDCFQKRYAYTPATTTFESRSYDVVIDLAGIPKSEKLKGNALLRKYSGHNKKEGWFVFNTSGQESSTNFDHWSVAISGRVTTPCEFPVEVFEIQGSSYTFRYGVAGEKEV